ncbi:hypothetical protein ScPMuIL_017447 [Solemya velum]
MATEVTHVSKDNIKSFKQLDLNDWLVTQCNTMGMKKPTPIQRNCILSILKGQDCIGCAKTGSGKTAAFALPILQKLSEDPYGIFALVLTPTRELAFQIAEQFNVLGQAYWSPSHSYHRWLRYDAARAGLEDTVSGTR